MEVFAVADICGVNFRDRGNSSPMLWGPPLAPLLAYTTVKATEGNRMWSGSGDCSNLLSKVVHKQTAKLRYKKKNPKFQSVPSHPK
jgi:hypothetical protein